MKTVIHDSHGVLLEVKYKPGPPAEGGPEIISVHVCDAQYRAVGPNLLHLLHACILLEPRKPGEGVTGEHFLSTLVPELV